MVLILRQQQWHSVGQGAVLILATCRDVAAICWTGQSAVGQPYSLLHCWTWGWHGEKRAHWRTLQLWVGSRHQLWDHFMSVIQGNAGEEKGRCTILPNLTEMMGPGSVAIGHPRGHLVVSSLPWPPSAVWVFCLWPVPGGQLCCNQGPKTMASGSLIVLPLGRPHLRRTIMDVSRSGAGSREASRSEADWWMSRWVFQD